MYSHAKIIHSLIYKNHVTPLCITVNYQNLSVTRMSWYVINNSTHVKLVTIFLMLRG